MFLKVAKENSSRVNKTKFDNFILLNIGYQCNNMKRERDVCVTVINLVGGENLNCIQKKKRTGIKMFQEF